jgi:hypothetical protein
MPFSLEFDDVYEVIKAAVTVLCLMKKWSVLD